MSLRLAVTLAITSLVACNEELIDPSDSVVIEIHQDDTSDTSTGQGCQVRLTYEGAPQATSVAAAGEWNGFTATPTLANGKMVEVDGVWVADLELAPGEYGYKLVVNGTFEGELQGDVPTHWVDGVENRNLVVPDCTRPSVKVERFEVADQTMLARLCFVAAKGGHTLAEPSITLDGRALTGAVDGGCVDLEEAVGTGKHRLDATVSDDVATSEPLWIPFWTDTFDWRDASLYMAMPDRFRDSDGAAAPVAGPEPIANWDGGDFGGLAQAIDEGWFSALGMSALWLTPVVKQPDEALIGSDNVHLYAGYHGYWPVSVDIIEPRLGGAEAFAALVAKAHAHGMRVVMDIVLNHVYQDHPYCDEGLCHTTCVCGTAGCDFDARARDCQFAPYLPDLDYRDHTTVMRVVDDVVAFIREHDIDGVRLDAVKHVDRSILQALRQRLHAIEANGGAPFWMVGETFTGGDGHAQIMQYVGPGRLDGQFDFPLYWTIRDTFINNGSFRNLEAALKQSEASYGDALALMSPFLGNHDVARFATAIANNDQGPFGNTPDKMAAGGATPSEWDIINQQSLAFVFLLTLRGVPLVYMGDELGLAGSSDPDNRRLLPRPDARSGNQQELLGRIRQLGVARATHAALRRGNRRELWIDDDLYVQARWLDVAAAPAGEPRVMLVAMNKGAVARSETITIPAELGIDGQTLSSLYSERQVTVTGGVITLTLNPSEYALLALQ